MIVRGEMVTLALVAAVVAWLACVLGVTQSAQEQPNEQPKEQPKEQPEEQLSITELKLEWDAAESDSGGLTNCFLVSLDPSAPNEFRDASDKCENYCDVFISTDNGGCCIVASEDYMLSLSGDCRMAEGSQP